MGEATDWQTIPPPISVPHPIGQKAEASAFVVKRILQPNDFAGEDPLLTIERFCTQQRTWRTGALPTRGGGYLIRRGGTTALRKVYAVLELAAPHVAVLRK